MPKIMCQICARWTQKEGCELQYKHYWHFRDCMLEVKDYSFMKEQPQGSSPMEQPVPEEVSASDRH